MGVFKTLWKASSWWAALIWFLVGGLAASIWGFIFFRGGNLIHLAVFIVFLVFSIYYLVKFLRLILGKSKKKLS